MRYYWDMHVEHINFAIRDKWYITDHINSLGNTPFNLRLSLRMCFTFS